MKNRLKYFILICGLFFGLNLCAQGTTCGSATAAILGTNFADGPSAGGGNQNVCGFDAPVATHAYWFTYTPSTNVNVIVESCLNGFDTRLSVFSGNCASLNCVVSSDDNCAHINGNPNEYASSVEFSAQGGTTYYFQWDDRWSNAAFNWTLTEVGLDCPALNLNIGDLCDGGVVNDACACVPLSTPSCPTLLSPADGATEVNIDTENDNAVFFTWALNGSQPHDAINIYWSATPGPPVLIGSIDAGSTSVILTSVSPGHYVWQIVPVNSDGEAIGCEIFTLSTVDAPPFECPTLNGNIGDPCPGGVISDICTCVPITVPDCPTMITPADGATGVIIDESNNTVYFEWILNGFQPEDEVSIYVGTSPGNLILQATGPAGAMVGSLNNFVPGVYYWSVIPANSVGPAAGCDIFQFSANFADCPDIGANFGDFCTTAEIVDGTISNSCVCVANAPLCPTLISPADGATISIDENILSWNIAENGTPTFAQWVFFGLAGQPSSFYTQLDGTVESLQLAPNDLVEVESYSWFILPLNEAFFGNDCSTELYTFTVESAVDNCPTDFNADGTTNGEDFSLFLGSFAIPCPASCPTDLNGDGVVDGTDFSLFLGNFGLDCTGPE